MSDTPTDTELVLTAQAGDVASLGLLLERHRAGMQAVALSMLGHSFETQDAVQDAMLGALRQIGELRDPEAAGPWLRAIVRNTCRMRLRGPSARSSLDLAVLTLPSKEPTPDELVDGHAMRDWVWHALDQLSEPLRLVVMLRYFGGASSYQDIAALCGVPVGTIRSRLNQAKLKLAEALLSTAAVAHPNVAARTAARRREMAEFFALAEQGHSDDAVAALCWPNFTYAMSGGLVMRGRDGFARELDDDYGAGVRLRLTTVMSGRDLLVVEGDFLNPADDPTHCPPSMVQVYFLRAGRAQRMHLFHSRASTNTDEDESGVLTA